ncbi:MAG: ATP-binding protein [Candidatus Binataceae bacterium]
MPIVEETASAPMSGDTVPGIGANGAAKPPEPIVVLRPDDIYRYRIKIWSGFILMVVAVVVVGAASYQSIVRLIVQNRRIDQTRFIIDNLLQAVSDVKGMMLAERGYAITLDNDYFKATEAASGQITQRMQALRQLAEGEPDQLHSLDKAEAAIAQLHAFAFQVMATRRSQGLSAVAALIATGQGEEKTETVERQLRAIADAQADLLAARTHAADLAGVRALRIIAAGTLLALICASFSGWFTRSSLSALRASSADLMRSHEQLQILNKELNRSNGELEQFAYSASHDLQEPLRMVASYVQLIRDRYRTRLDADADDFIDFAVDGAARMKRLINDLLVYSRAGRGRAPRPMESGQALEWAISNLALRISESHTTISHGPLPVVVADSTQLGEVFQNLIENAIKFHGGQPPAINVTAQTRNGEWLFSVKDNGIGISPEHRERIFQMFQRLHGRNEYSGTGIGLAVCRRIVERHGGTIWVESEEGSGADFRFTMPMAPAEGPIAEVSA